MPALVRILHWLGALGVERFGKRVRAFVDLFTGIGLILVNIWVLSPRDLWVGQLIVNLVGTLWVASAVVRMLPTHRDQFPSVPSPALPRFLLHALVTLGLAGLLLVTAALFGFLEPEAGLSAFGKPVSRIPGWILTKSFACFAQQLLLFWFVFPLSWELTGGRARGALLGAIVFSLAHVPNWLLVVTTLGVAPVWYVLYARVRMPLMILASHVLLATLIRFAIPSHIHLDLNVGEAAAEQLREIDWLERHGFRERIETYSSREYYDRCGGTDRAFIHGLYRDILERDETEDCNEKWRRSMSYRTRRDIAMKFFLSTEFLEDILGLGGPEDRQSPDSPSQIRPSDHPIPGAPR